MRRPLLSLLVVLVLAACSQPGSEPSPTPEPQPPVTNLRPAGSPDVVVLAFSGRCASIPHPLDCIPPFDNYTYLDDDFSGNTPVQTRQAVVAAFASLGYSAEYVDVSAFIGTHYSNMSDAYELGYAEAETYVERVQQEWVADFDNPTRIVLLAHSHGTVWASLLAWNHPDVTFDYFIYLDGICTQWPQDNLMNNPLIQTYYGGDSSLYPWPLNKTDSVCQRLDVPGLPLQDINDVTPWNVAFTLEVRSNNSLPNYTWDDDPNHRPDASTSNIATVESIGENHGDVTHRYGSAMTWVKESILLNGLPQYSAQGMTAESVPGLKRVAAPEGYRYHEP